MTTEELEKAIGWERPCIIESKETTESILFQRLKRRLAWEQKAREHETARANKAIEKSKNPPRPSTIWSKRDWIIFYHRIKYLL